MEKQRWEESEKRREEERRSEKRKSQKNEDDAGARKGRKVATHCVFPMICGSGGSKSRLAKAAGEEPSGQMRDEKVHAVVARSTFRSQNVQNTPTSEHFWKLRCRKSARHCGAKHISKSNALKLTVSDHFWKLRWCWKVHAVVAQSTFPSQSAQNTPKCWPANNEAGFDGTPSSWFLFWGYKALEDSWFTCSILVICDYLLCGRRCGSARDCSKGDRGWTGLDGLQLHSSRIALCGCTGLVFCCPPPSLPGFGESRTRLALDKPLAGWSLCESQVGTGFS